MENRRITKRTIESIKPADREFTIWDTRVAGFGVRVRPTDAKSFVVVYRAGWGRRAPVRRYTIAAVGKIAPERARARAVAILGSVVHGLDPAEEKANTQACLSVTELVERFMSEHVRQKRKPRTAEFYRDIFDRLVKPAFGSTNADKLNRQQVAKLHSSLRETPFQANRVLAALGSMYGFARRVGVVAESFNPVCNIEK